MHIYNLALEFNINDGYRIIGPEIQKRSVVLSLISRNEYLLKFSPLEFYDNDTLQRTKEYMYKLEEELDITYVRTTLNTLALLISIIQKQEMNDVVLEKDDTELIQETLEYKAIQKIAGNSLETNEQLYLGLHLLGLRVNTMPLVNDDDADYVQEIVDFLLREFSKETLIYFDEDHDLIRQLYIHMKQALYRFRYGIIYQNELRNEVIETYPQISNVARRICLKLEKKIGYPIGEDDVTFIAMHFGGALKRQNREIKLSKVLLVCLNGIATSKLLRKELEYMFGNLDIIDAVSLEDIKIYKDDVDYIISTIPIRDKSIRAKVLQVNPVLTEHDKANLVMFMNINNEDEIVELSKQIVQAIESYIEPSKKSKVQKIILKKLNIEKRNTNVLTERIRKPMLNELLTNERILFEKKLATWEDAIWLSAKPLIEDQSVEKRYVEKVITNVIEMGPYIGIAPDIAISHARPEDGVNEIGMTILIMKEPVYLNNKENKPVRVMITLAAPDNEKHLLALQQLSLLLMEELDTLLKAEESETVMNLVNKYSN